VAVFLLRFVTAGGESDRVRLHLGLDPRRPGLPDLGVATSLELSDRPTLVAGLRALRVAHVHLHSTGAGGADGAVWIESIAHDLGVPLDVTAHDYAAICPRHHLEDESGRYCGEPDEEGCRRCLSERGSRYGAVDIANWRREWHGVFAAADRVVCPVEDVRRRFEARWSELRYEVRAHPEPADASVDTLASDSGRGTASLTVLVPGSIGLQKGFRVVCAAAEEARRNARPIRFVVVGHTTDDAAAARAGIRVTGPYERAEADARLAAEATGSCLALLPSVSPETWGATLSSAWRVGLHPVVFDLGAYAERVRARGEGTVLPLELADTPAALNEALLDLAASGVARRRPVWGADAHRQQGLVAGAGAAIDDYAGLVSTADRRSWVFVDRDGVLSMHTSGWVRSLADWRPIPESLDAVVRLTRAGHRVVVLTNQSVVGRGLAEAAVVEKIHDRLREQVAARGGHIDGIFACLHHPEDGCDCRKPASGLFHRAQSEIGASPTSAPFVGDQWTDVIAAQRAGARPILVGDWAGRPRDAGLERVERFADLASFVQAFLDESAARLG
jgi:histidinol-phosphate phosphatase family protein